MRGIRRTVPRVFLQGSRTLLTATARTIVVATLAFAGPALSQTLRELSGLSIEELSQVEITSVSKRAEPLSQAPAAVYVITADDIRRSGATTLPEALRLAPNLEVARVDSQTYNISSRGMNSVNASNKLLVLIDGRSIYTPFFSSVFWDQQTVMLADIDRIEVVSGPGGTLWGANAMNGVINIITKSSADTQGGLVDAKGGDFERRADGRYGGKLGDIGTYRAYALGYGESHTYLQDGRNAMDDWRGQQAGFRSDIAALASRFTVQGDLYENLIDTPGGHRSGGNLLGRWNRELTSASSLQVQAYYDEQERSTLAQNGGGSSERVRTFDVEAQHVFTQDIHQVVWGVGHRTWVDRFINTANPFVLVPESETLSVTDVFGQDTIALRDDLKLTLGSKFEYATFSGWAVMPNVRVGWQSDQKNFMWGAISRAVRSPSRIERDLTAPGIVNQSLDFRSEKLIAYETGWRSQLSSSASASLSLFYNEYTDLRTTKPNPVTVLPVTFGNGWEGHTYGLDAWGSVTPSSWWRIDAGYELLRKRFHLKPGELDIAGIQTVLGHDPSHQVFLRSYMDLPGNAELYVGLRQIGSLSDVRVPSYFEADVRIGVHVTPGIELSLAGLNLLHARHAEASGPPIQEIPRSVYAGVRWTF
ncbi:MAG TPA: TonB-dependent receptor [Casimicrobiaceae bacterium]|nr:TonB-dependent receptor [Casimicrobiaceae bacterium]